jgi:uncharacterized membrane protein
MAPFEPFQIYWKTYGGFKALVRSLYLWVSVALTGACFPLWTDRGFMGDERPITATLLSLVPALMAFTLAGMAIVLALSGKRFVTAIREDGREDSLFMKIVVYFFHFILVQTVALVLSLLAASYVSQTWLAALAFFFAVYGVASALSIAAMLLNVSRIYNLTGGDD